MLSARVFLRQIVGYRNICRIRKWKCQRQLNYFLARFHSPESFYQYCEEIGQDKHLTGSMFRTVQERQAIFIALFKELCLDVKGKSFLDLGPGSGESLDVAKDFGAFPIGFADYDPYILAYNILKGYCAFHTDYYVEGVNRVLPKMYDVVVSRGSINADRFNREEPGILSFNAWLSQLEQCGNLAIICPTFDQQKNPCLDAYSPYQWIPDLTYYDESLVNQTFLKHGFKRTFIKGFNEPAVIFPYTYIKEI